MSSYEELLAKSNSVINSSKEPTASYGRIYMTIKFKFCIHENTVAHKGQTKLSAKKKERKSSEKKVLSIEKKVLSIEKKVLSSQMKVLSDPYGPRYEKHT